MNVKGFVRSVSIVETGHGVRYTVHTNGAWGTFAMLTWRECKNVLAYFGEGE